jgi:hypothetical protein
VPQVSPGRNTGLRWVAAFPSRQHQVTHATSNPIIRAEDLLRVTTDYLNRIAETVRFHGV